jgi:hypothetical protein
MFSIAAKEAKITCLNGKCTPTVAGPSNACIYICGKLACDKM